MAITALLSPQLPTPSAPPLRAHHPPNSPLLLPHRCPGTSTTTPSAAGTSLSFARGDPRQTETPRTLRGTPPCWLRSSGSSEGREAGPDFVVRQRLEKREIVWIMVKQGLRTFCKLLKKKQFSLFVRNSPLITPAPSSDSPFARQTTATPNPRNPPPRDSGARFTGDMPSGGSAKRRRGRETEAAEAEADALISLAPVVLDDILTRLGIRDAVRTSALSRAWRRRWEALPFLDLYFPRPEDGDEGAPEELGTVDGILLRYPSRIRLFRADLDDTYAGRIHDWLRVLSRRGVETLDLSFSGSFPSLPALPSTVFSCGRLTWLGLCGCSIPLLPSDFVAFPQLVYLALQNVRLQEYGEGQLEEIIATSPLLHYLYLADVLIGGAYVKKVVIRAPNLGHLIIFSGNIDIWILEELTSLDYANICVSDSFVHHDFAEFLSGLVQVKKLLVDTCGVPSSLMTPEKLLCTFCNLKSLKFHMHFCRKPPIMLTLCLLKSAPNLEKLKIEEFEANGEFLNALWTDGMCANLQVVQMIGINWRPNEMSFIELILSKARLLHTFFISHSEDIVMSNEDALNELLRYRRASAEAQVLFEGKAENY